MKNWFENTIAYMRDNPEGYWFKRKLYGWGWYPASWQGWLVTLGAAAVVLLNALRFEYGGHPESEVVKQVLLPTCVVVVVLIIVCFKTGESPRWQWGPPQSEPKDEEETQ